MAVKKADGRKRNFATVVYPDSAPENWIDILSDHKVPAFVSPLHDKDVDPDPEKGGQCKKAHYHVMIMFAGKKSDDQAREIFDSIGGVGCEVVNDIRSYARYLCHLDNPNKAQYDPEQVLKLAGADYMNIIGLASDKYKAIEEMMEFCRDNSLYSYAKLMEYAAINRRDWFRSLCDNSSYVMREYLKSLRWEDEELSADDHDDIRKQMIEGKARSWNSLHPLPW